MSRNSIAALAIFTFLWNWEGLPLAVPHDHPMTTSSCCRWASNVLPASTAPDYGGLFAATSVTIIPVVISLPGVPEAVHRRYRHRLWQ